MEEESKRAKKCAERACRAAGTLIASFDGCSREDTDRFMDALTRTATVVSELRALVKAGLCKPEILRALSKYATSSADKALRRGRLLIENNDPSAPSTADIQNYTVVKNLTAVVSAVSKLHVTVKELRV